MLNGLLVLVTLNVALDLIPRYGILGAAIAWTAIFVSNIVPLVQLAVVFRLHPFGRTSISAAALTVVGSLCRPASDKCASWAGGWASLVAGVIAGSVVMGAGLRFRGALKLQGVARLPRIRARRPGGR